MLFQGVSLSCSLPIPSGPALNLMDFATVVVLFSASPDDRPGRVRIVSYERG
jgi:hypothetical protein